MLKVGIVGIGTVAQVHLKALKNTDIGKLVAVCDIDQIKLRDFNDIATYTDIDTMLKNEHLDVIHVCLPHYLHVPAVIKCASNGVNVFEEKPVGINLEEVKQLFSLEAKYNIKIGVCFQNRLNNTTIKLKEIVKSGAFGKILGTKGLVTWNRKMAYYKQSPWRGTIKEAGGGVMLNQSIHTLDLLNFIVDDFKDVYAKTANLTLPEVEIEDSIMANLSYKNIDVNAIFFATIGYCTDSGVEVEVVFEKATFKIAGGILYKIINDEYESICEDARLEGTKHYYGAAHQICIEQFYQAILNNTNNYTNVQSASKSIAIIDAINLSSETNKKVIIGG
ncbi:hypothetical protein AN641_07160 [Candidatus Epulonipiscioides gigas]|nr:hypothetical protein AN641_07160 [Epulopiscium sp. SCG-C07WGA-EpuloA2]